METRKRIEPPRRPLNNETCPYCGTELDETTATKEHVVGRNFVPKGKLNSSWNLILRACSTCNVRKSELEDDLSAISMSPDASGTFAHTDSALHSQAERKGRSVHRRTKKSVAESAENFTLTGKPLPNLSMSVSFVAPPQADPQRIVELSRMQIAAFFYGVMTYKPELRRGGFWTPASSRRSRSASEVTGATRNKCGSSIRWRHGIRASLPKLPMAFSRSLFGGIRKSSCGRGPSNGIITIASSASSARAQTSKRLFHRHLMRRCSSSVNTIKAN